MVPPRKKRPAAAPSAAKRAPKAKRQKTAAVPDPNTPPPGRPSLFLALPPELRNHVYSFVAADAPPVVLHPKTRGRRLSKSPLMTLSKQVSEEYQAMLYFSVPGITAYVKDFDFGHVVTFLNKLSEAEVKALPSLNTANAAPAINIPTERKVLVELEITKACAHNPESLHRWLTRCGHPTKKGTRLDVTYTAKGDGGNVSVWTSPYQPRSTASQVREVLQKKATELGRVDKGRVYQELLKILQALNDLQ